jgi:hypothetical protein
MVGYKRRTRLSPPATYHTVLWGGTQFLDNTKPDTTSALGLRISLEAFLRNPLDLGTLLELPSPSQKTHKVRFNKTRKITKPKLEDRTSAHKLNNLER